MNSILPALVLRASAWLLVAAAACRSPDRDPALTPYLRELSEMTRARQSLARLSVPTTPLECDFEESPCVARDTTEASAALLAMSARAARAIRQQPDADMLHAAGLLELLWPSDAGKSIARSISYMQRAVAMSDSAVGPLNDLAAALITRAHRTDDPRDFLAALEVADRVLERDSMNLAGRFTRALALEGVGASQSAGRAWRAYAALDPRSQWGEAARRRSERLTARSAHGANGSRQAARVSGWDTTLVAWSAAELEGNVAVADALLSKAEAVGSSLARDSGDASLRDAVRLLRTATPDMRRRLARSHGAYGEGMARFREGNYAAARAALATSAALCGTSPLRHWANVGIVASRLPIEGAVVVVPAALAGVASIDTTRYPALGARARWVAATTLIRAGRSEEALDLVHQATSLFARAGESENVGAMDVMAGDAAYRMGDMAAMHASMRRGLTRLREHPRSLWRHNLLYVWAEATAGEWPRAAGDLQEEGIDAAVANGSPPVIAEARLARARLAAVIGGRSRTRAEAALARPLLEALPVGPRREWLEADLALADATLMLATYPDSALADLDTVVARFDRRTNTARLLPALVARAEARVAAGRDADGEADLERVATLVQAQHDVIREVRFRASTLETARRTIDRLVMRRIAAGRVGEALAYIDRARGSLTPFTTTPDRSAPLVGPPGEVALEFALVGDTLLTWSVSGTDVRLVRATVNRDKLSQLIERARIELESASPELPTRAVLAALYDILIRPVAPRLGRDESSVVIVADGEIGSVPFAALFDSVSKRYFVERHAIRFTPRLSPHQERRGSSSSSPRALLIAEPLVQSSRNLEPLPGARAEVAAVAQQYAAPRVVVGREANRQRVMRDLTGVDVLHFAGHAVFDDGRPEQSRLLLADAPGQRGELLASEVAALDLRAVKLVVLSACETARPHPGRSGGFAGFTGAFLAAGAQGVVGTLWRVDDEAVQSLVVDFHRAYRATGGAASALRAAQVAALRSSDPRTRSPAAWAAFRYSGA